jgi:colicin import membrane protein
VLAVLVHVILFGFLFFGLRWSVKAPDAVVVELWTQPAVSEPVPKVEPVPEPKPAPKPEPAPVPKVETPPPPAPKAAAPVRKPDIAIEKEKKPTRKEEPKLQIDARSRMQEQLARETQALAQERQKAPPTATAIATATATPRPPPPAAATVIDPGYANRIRLKIKGTIVVPSDISGNPEAIFDVIQLPTGEVLSATLRKSSGYRAFDDAVERAILKSSPLPRPENPSQFQRQLDLKFRPQE